jgi:hypothetical protein
MLRLHGLNRYRGEKYRAALMAKTKAADDAVKAKARAASKPRAAAQRKVAAKPAQACIATKPTQTAAKASPLATVALTGAEGTSMEATSVKMEESRATLAQPQQDMKPQSAVTVEVASSATVAVPQPAATADIPQPPTVVTATGTATTSSAVPPLTNATVSESAIQLPVTQPVEASSTASKSLETNMTLENSTAEIGERLTSSSVVAAASAVVVKLEDDEANTFEVAKLETPAPDQRVLSSVTHAKTSADAAVVPPKSLGVNGDVAASVAAPPVLKG